MLTCRRQVDAAVTAEAAVEAQSATNWKKEVAPVSPPPRFLVGLLAHMKNDTSAHVRIDSLSREFSTAFLVMRCNSELHPGYAAGVARP